MSASKREAGASRKIVTLLLVGAGNRGTIYTNYALEHPHLCKVVGVAEPRKFARGNIAHRHAVSKSRVFTTWEDAAALPRFADAVVITTQDSLHRDPAVAFANLGYHILLEKPMAVNITECVDIVNAVKSNNVILSVGHVLRYMPYTRMFKDLVESGAIGKVVNAQHLEPIGYWHFAHSYVRGSWRKESEGTFMLMAKCCHDVDWLKYVVGGNLVRVSSFGSVANFSKEFKPDGAADRCLDCDHKDSCPYSATRIYLDRIKAGHVHWPVSSIVPTEEPDIENVTQALRDGPYGRCAWECDNDVMDNQVVNMQYEGGATVNLTTVAFTKALCVRHTRVFGTLGELEGDGDSTIIQRNFVTGEETRHRSRGAPDYTSLAGHNGADFFLMQAFIEAVATGDRSHVLSGPDETLASHLAVFAAEQSRVRSCVVDFAEFLADAKAQGDDSDSDMGNDEGVGAGAGAGAGAGSAAHVAV